MDSRFESLEKSMDDKYHELNDRLIDIKTGMSYHYFKLQEYFKVTGHENLPSPSLHLRTLHHMGSKFSFPYLLFLV